MAIENIEFEAGYIVLTYEAGGIPKRWSIADILRAADIPTGLTYSQVQAVTALANLIAVLTQTLIAREVLDENFLEDGGYNLVDIVQSIDDMGGDFIEPDISVE